MLGNTEWESFDNAVAKLFSGPKQTFTKADAVKAKNRKKLAKAKKSN